MILQVPQGFAAEEPKKYVLDDQEYERISKLAQIQLDDARDEEPDSSKTSKEKLFSDRGLANFRMKDEETDGDELKAYNLDTYDVESAEDEEKEGTGTV